MKKNIFKLLFIIMIMFALVGCNYNNVTITYVIKDDIKTIEYDRYMIITSDILSSLTSKEIEGVYLDSSYQTKYNDFEIKDDMMLYIKIKEVTVTLKYKEKEEKIVIDKNSSINLSMVTILEDDKIEGLYLDENYTIKYNNEIIKEDITLYIHEYIYDGITQELYDEIKRDYIDKYYYYLGDQADSEQIKIAEFVCNINGTIIAKFYDMFDYENCFFDLVWKETIEGVDIWNTNSNIYRVWNNGEFYKLQEAFEKNVITKDDLVTISKITNKSIDTSQSTVIKIDDIVKLDTISRIEFLYSFAYNFCSTKNQEVINEIIELFVKNKEISIDPKIAKSQSDIVMKDNQHSDLSFYYRENNIIKSFSILINQEGDAILWINDIYFAIVSSEKFDKMKIYDMILGSSN